MPREFDLEDDEERIQRHEDGEGGATCRRCGATGLHWRSVTTASGLSETRRLVDDQMRRHVCQPRADDFEAL